MKSLSIKELRAAKAKYEQAIDERKQLLIDQISDLRVEAAFATQATLLRLEGALNYVGGSIEYLEEESLQAENAKEASK